MSDLKFKDDLTVSNGVVSKITPWGFKDFAFSLGLSNQLVRKLPNDLLVQNMTELMGQRGSKDIVVLRRSNGDIATIVEPPFRAPDPSEVVTLFQEMHALDKFEIGEDLVQYSIPLSSAPIIVPNQHTLALDDETHVAAKVVWSLYRKAGLEAALYLFRLICTNGAMMTRMYNKVAIDSRLTSDLRLTRFREDVGKMIASFSGGMLQSNFEQMMNSHFTNEFISRIWNRVAAQIGTGGTDTIFGFDTDSRQILLRTADTERLANKEKKLRGDAPEWSEFNRLSQWEVYNAVTNLANDITGRKKLFLQTVGGDIVAKVFSLN